MKYLLGVLALTVTQGLPADAAAQAYPSRPITMVVPFPAGAGFDAIGRIFALRMGEILGQQIIVENIGGAAGVIGTARVANAAPDGHVFLLGSVGTHAYTPAIHARPPYDSVADFAPVALFAEQPMLLITRKDFPAGNFPDFVAHARANAPRMQYGSAGTGSTTHFACASLNAALGVTIMHVPYRGGAAAMTDLMTGQIDYMCVNSSGALPQIASGALRAIALLSHARSPVVPDLPTAHEQGLSGFHVTTWNAFFLPKGTPAAIVEKLNRATVEAMDTPSVQRRMHDLGVTLVAPERRTPEYLAKFLQAEIDKWAAVIKANGIRTE